MYIKDTVRKYLGDSAAYGRRFDSPIDERGQQLRQGLEQLVQRHPTLLAGTRGWGLLQGVVLQDDCSCTAAQLAAAAIDQRLLLVAAGPRVLRMVPPLVISRGEVQELLKRLEATLAAAS